MDRRKYLGSLAGGAAVGLTTECRTTRETDGGASGEGPEVFAPIHTFLYRIV